MKVGFFNPQSPGWTNIEMDILPRVGDRICLDGENGKMVVSEVVHQIGPHGHSAQVFLLPEFLP